MGNLGYGKPMENPASVQSPLVDWSLMPFPAEQCFRFDFQSVPEQLRVGIPLLSCVSADNMIGLPKNP